jgi:predicted metal-dependent hydrolase
MEQLSLLDPVPLTATGTPAVPVGKPQPKVPLAQVGVGLSAPPVGPQGLWQHPQANREAVLQGRAVRYWLRRGLRKTIGFSVGPQGLSVSAPRWTPLSAVDAALQDKADWVVRKLAQVGQRHEALEAGRVAWADGTTLAWLGGTLTVRLGQPPGGPGMAPTATPRRRGQPLVHRAAPGTAGPDTLWVALPTTATAAQLRDAVQAWMMQAAHAHFVQRLDHFAPLLGVRWALLKLSAATTRWGSAKADGSIRLHWRLMQFAPDVVDYVVAHELAHLRHMDHSDRFWQTVAGVVPDYAALRARLKGERLPPW